MANFKELTLLHSNDMHGDFLAEQVDDDLVGGVSLLSGYVEKVRNEKHNTLYCIAGDMLQGSLIDTEFHGLSTVDIMNMINPDVVALGNHEVDYGLAHLLFLERCSRFPIVNANLFIKRPLTRIFTPYIFIERDGMKIMFIGIITEDVLSGIRSDNLISSLVDVEDAAREVGKICNSFKTTDVDLTVLLTHIGFEEDKQLASMLDPDWGVDIIIGGHTHTILDEPAQVNGVLVVQAGIGTNQIGRFDLVIDTDTNSISEYSWQLVPIDSDHCPCDPVIDRTVELYKSKTDEKYGRVLCRLPRALTHPSRYQETELGSLFADVFKHSLGVDISFLGSGAVRKPEAGPVLTHGDVIEIAPFNDKVYRLQATGEQLRRICRYILRDEAFEGDHTEFFQFSVGVEMVYSRRRRDFEDYRFMGEPLSNDQLYTISLQEYHRNNCATSLGIPIEELYANGRELVLTTAEQDVLIEYFAGHVRQQVPKSGRLVVVE